MEGGSILFLQNTGYLSAHKFQVGGLSPSYHHWSPEEGVSDFARQLYLICTTYRVFFDWFTLKMSDYTVNPFEKVLSVRISKGSGIFRADQ